MQIKIKVTICRKDSFLIELTGVTLVNKRYRFQEYKSIIHHMYILLCVHYAKPSLLPSPLIPHPLFLPYPLSLC